METLLQSSDYFYSVCRKILNNVMESTNNPNLTMNSLIIVVMFALDDAFLKQCKTSIDLALTILCSGNNEVTVAKSSTDILKNNYDLCFSKLNALNFLMEIFKRDEVIKILELG